MTMPDMMPTTPPSGGVVLSVEWASQQAALADLFREFYFYLRHEHGFDAQAILEDAEGLPGSYAAPEGDAFIAWVEGMPAGCFCLRPYQMDDQGRPLAEAKRMYIRPLYRGLGLGSKLLDAVLHAARMRGYHAILLDSLRSLPAAHRLYFSRGFTLIPPYNELSADDVFHMRCELSQ